MSFLKLKLHKFPWRLKRKVNKLLEQMYLMRWSFCYNKQTSYKEAVFTLFTPVEVLNDFIRKKYGVIFMAAVIFMGVSVNVIYVSVILPDIYTQTPLLVPIYFIIGLWLLVNATFNYFMGAFVGPGYPPVEVSEVVTVCRKCFMKKPPRTHHCRVCNRCVLKMDHHCPWFNNCVGFLNHRYFLLFTVYTCLGTLLICYSSNDQFVQIFYGDTLQVYPFPGSMFLLNLMYASYATNPNITLLQQSDTYDRIGLLESMQHQAIVYCYIVASGVSLALIILNLVSIRMVSRGETTIEAYINLKERGMLRKKNKVFHNSYHYGFMNNWQMLLGIEKGTGRTFWRHVLFPSNHKPEGDGMTWPKQLNYKETEIFPL